MCSLLSLSLFVCVCVCVLEASERGRSFALGFTQLSASYFPGNRILIFCIESDYVVHFFRTHWRPNLDKGSGEGAECRMRTYAFVCVSTLARIPAACRWQPNMPPIWTHTHTHNCKHTFGANLELSGQWHSSPGQYDTQDARPPWSRHTLRKNSPPTHKFDSTLIESCVCSTA